MKYVREKGILKQKNYNNSCRICNFSVQPSDTFKYYSEIFCKTIKDFKNISLPDHRIIESRKKMI